VGVRYDERPGFELVTQLSGIKPESCLLGEYARIYKPIAQNLKLVFKAALSNRLKCSAWMMTTPSKARR
jgi:hypothetical protein